jgi:hypothetical protein
MVSAMKTASTELKAQMKAMNIDEIEDLHDDMSEMLEMTDEIQEVRWGSPRGRGARMQRLTRRLLRWHCVGWCKGDGSVVRR